MSHQLIECVPNFSEGNDISIINKICDEIKNIKGVRLLNVDAGKAANRTVVTMIGAPQKVIDAAFNAIKKASELINMQKHKGEHPRIGATDVCPLIPIANISLEDTAKYAVQLAKRVGDELNIPIYLYEAAQPNLARKNLSIIRAGEYEGFFEKIKIPNWKPDFGPAEMNKNTGATVIGAREILVAYNINLNTSDNKIATEIAKDIRETGRKIILDGKKIHQPGTLKNVKAIGWFIKDFGVAQVSINFTNLNITPVHIAYEAVCKAATAYGVKVTGSELIGLIPLKAMTDAGKYFLQKQQQNTSVSEAELIATAIKFLGLDDLETFDPNKRIIEYLLKENYSDDTF